MVRTLEARRQGPLHLGGQRQRVDVAVALVVPGLVAGNGLVGAPLDLDPAVDEVVVRGKDGQDGGEVSRRVGAVVRDDVVPEERPCVGVHGARDLEMLVLAVVAVAVVVAVVAVMDV